MIPAKEIGYILRSLGQNPTEDDIIALVCEAGCDWEGYLTADDFLAVALVAMQKQVDRMDDVKAAFRSVSECAIHNAPICDECQTQSARVWWALL